MQISKFYIYEKKSRQRGWYGNAKLDMDFVPFTLLNFN